MLLLKYFKNLILQVSYINFFLSKSYRWSAKHASFGSGVVPVIGMKMFIILHQIICLLGAQSC